MELPNGVPLDVAQAQLVKFSPAQEAARKVFEQMYGPVQGGANPAGLQTPLPDQASSQSGPGDMDSLMLEGEGAESGVRGQGAGENEEISMKSAAEQLAVCCTAVMQRGMLYLCLCVRFVFICMCWWGTPGGACGDYCVSN